MMRLIDSTTLILKSDGKSVPLHDIVNAPTIDPVHAAGACYCWECKHWNRVGIYPNGRAYGNCVLDEADGVVMVKRDNDFCSYGERRKNNDT